MDEALQSSCSLPPFLSKTYEMVDDSSCDSIVSWSSSNRSFVVLNLAEFEQVLLPKFFKHGNFSSFNRQLNTYGFRKIDPEQWEFANENFIKGKPHLMKNIHRRKPVHSHSFLNLSSRGSSPMAESEKQRFKTDIEGLKQDKERLHLELQRHEENGERFEFEIQVLNEKLRRLQEHQSKLVGFLARILRNPSFDLNLVPQFEFHDRKRRLPRSDFYQDEDNLMGKSRSGLLNMVRFELLETSLVFLENIVLDLRQTSNIEIDESTTLSESLSISEIPLNVSDEPRSPGIDMNSEPLQNKHPNMETGVNDVFWEQFLTENPGSSNSPEVQSERKDCDLKKGEIKGIDQSNSLPDRIGHLAPVENTRRYEQITRIMSSMFVDESWNFT